MNKVKLFATAAVTFGALFSLQAPLSAQTIGFKVGQTFSKFDIEDDDTPQDYLSKLGGGGFIRFGLGGLGMQAELLALTKGTKVEDGATAGSLKVDYIEVPVLARFGLGMSPSISPYLMVGPSFAFKTGCSVEATDGTVTGSVDCGDEDGFKSFDLGATGVAGLEFRAGPGNILVEGRYTHGLLNINDDDESTTTGGNVMNRSFAVMAGYAITLR